MHTLLRLSFRLSYAFGLEETNFREEAASLSHKCLTLQPQSPWATHTISHVVEESRDPQEGVDFLLKTRKDWEDTGLGHHISWHLMLHYLGERYSACYNTSIHHCLYIVYMCKYGC